MNTFNWYVVIDTIDEKGWVVMTQENLCSIVGMPMVTVATWFADDVNYMEWNDFVIVKNPIRKATRPNYRKKKK